MKPVLLGTAQWGLDYGVTNHGGLIGDPALEQIARAAHVWAIESLDTSPAYGVAESRIAGLPETFRIQTKCRIDATDQLTPAESLRASTAACGRAPERLLIHDWSSADESRRANAAVELERLRDSGAVQAVGVSAYAEEDLSSALEHFRRLDIVQVPANALDQRLVNSRVISEARAQGTLVQARSIFLQGVLLSVASPFASHPDVLRFFDLARSREHTALEMVVGFVMAQDWIDEVTFGVTSSAELEEIMNAMRTCSVSGDLSLLSSADTQLIDPRRW